MTIDTPPSAPAPPVVTNELRQQFLRIATILMPHFRQKHTTMYENPDRPGRFVHYASAEAALKIIQSKQLWMRNATCMTDYREVTHGYEILLRYFADQTKTSSFFQALEPCAPGVGQEALTLFNRAFQDVQLNTYIACLSEHNDREDLHGRLSMWRAFGGGNAPRVAVVIKVPKETDAAIALGVFFSPIAYSLEHEVHAQLDQVVQNICDEVEFLRSLDRQVLLSSLFSMLVAAVTCLKHPGFDEEREWRVVYSPNRHRSPLVSSSTEIVSGIPQVVHKLPFDRKVSPILADLDLSVMFDRLIVGPTPYPWAVRGAFVEALTAAGVQDADNRVWASTIPIRG